MDPRSNYFWPAIRDMLAGRQLFLNSRTNFNDPYDSQPIIKEDLASSAIREYAADMIANPMNPKRDATDIARILELRSTGKMRLNKIAINNIKADAAQNAGEFLDQGGLLSFSLVPDHPLLWGHYAAAFSGLCAVFKRNHSPQSALQVCAKVSYVQQRPQLPLSLAFELGTSHAAGTPNDELADTIFYLSFLHKSHHWAYEQEARIFYPFKALQKLSFEASELRAFLLGPRASSELETQLKDEIKNANFPAEVHKASLSRTDFRVIIPHKFLP